jgi:hypothetical protein
MFLRAQDRVVGCIGGGTHQPKAFSRQPEIRRYTLGKFIRLMRPNEPDKSDVRTALLEHKRIGNSIAVWEEGKFRIVPTDEIDELLEQDINALGGKPTRTSSAPALHCGRQIRMSWTWRF